MQIKEEIPKKNSYERRDYESVDDKSLLLSYIPKTYVKKNSGSGELKWEWNDMINVSIFCVFAF